MFLNCCSGGGYGSKDGHDRDNSVYQHESNPYAGANASYELQGYGSQGGVPYQQVHLAFLCTVAWLDYMLLRVGAFASRCIRNIQLPATRGML